MRFPWQKILRVVVFAMWTFFFFLKKSLVYRFLFFFLSFSFFFFSFFFFHIFVLFRLFLGQFERSSLNFGKPDKSKMATLQNQLRNSSDMKSSSHFPTELKKLTIIPTAFGGFAGFSLFRIGILNLFSYNFCCFGKLCLF